jgi:hypothetical protein
VKIEKVTTKNEKVNSINYLFFKQHINYTFDNSKKGKHLLKKSKSIVQYKKMRGVARSSYYMQYQPYHS